LLSPRRLYGTIFSKMKPSKGFHTAWAHSGSSLRCKNMSAYWGTPDQK
jgi:hypothetical protein